MVSKGLRVYGKVRKEVELTGENHWSDYKIKDSQEEAQVEVGQVKVANEEVQVQNGQHVVNIFYVGKV